MSNTNRTDDCRHLLTDEHDQVALYLVTERLVSHAAAALTHALDNDLDDRSGAIERERASLTQRLALLDALREGSTEPVAAEPLIDAVEWLIDDTAEGVPASSMPGMTDVENLIDWGERLARLARLLAKLRETQGVV